jgi:hypothetical protein
MTDVQSIITMLGDSNHDFSKEYVKWYNNK